MSAAAVSSRKAAPRTKVAPKTKAAGAPKPAPAHPTYAVMVADAIEQLKERSGSSKTAILKYMTQHYNLGDNVTMINVHVKRAITRGLAKGELQQVTGMGATGSFKLASSNKQKNPVSPKEKKPIAKKITDQLKAPKKMAIKPAVEKKLKVATSAAAKTKAKEPVQPKPKAKKSVKATKKPVSSTKA
ncbi:unnamed protein product [Cylicocyclus nassatus]|uniref:H15 domain-containing protein n=1 Tax=Cylicocyclus nassatus TaxID=53992 RepID=A0AA36GSR5_CYLNA|nr:unnamed protein product [Cylicocyclus nassatus]